MCKPNTVDLRSRLHTARLKPITRTRFFEYGWESTVCCAKNHLVEVLQTKCLGPVAEMFASPESAYWHGPVHDPHLEVAGLTGWASMRASSLDGCAESERMGRGPPQPDLAISAEGFRRSGDLGGQEAPAGEGEVSLICQRNLLYSIWSILFKNRLLDSAQPFCRSGRNQQWSSGYRNWHSLQHCLVPT